MDLINPRLFKVSAPRYPSLDISLPSPASSVASSLPPRRSPSRSNFSRPPTGPSSVYQLWCLRFSNCLGVPRKRGRIQPISQSCHLSVDCWRRTGNNAAWHHTRPIPRRSLGPRRAGRWLCCCPGAFPLRSKTTWVANRPSSLLSWGSPMDGRAPIYRSRRRHVEDSWAKYHTEQRDRLALCLRDNRTFRLY